MQRRRAILTALLQVALVSVCTAVFADEPGELPAATENGGDELQPGAPNEASSAEHDAGASPDPTSSPDSPPEGKPAADAGPSTATSPTQAFPDDPADRLELARDAFRRTNYAVLVPLLAGLGAADTPFETIDERVEARELLAVGYFFQAQQATNATDRDALLEEARRVFLTLLRDKPDHSLDNLIFPASVVDLFEQVREDHAEELDALLAEQNDVSGIGDLQTIYIERTATRRIGWVNFLPFGAGQIQNEQYAKATAFAILQAGGLAVNATSYFVILNLRREDGTTSTEGGTNSDYATALRWRQVLYGGLAGFGVVWALSIIDAWLNFEPENVRIRTLDAPPPELDGVSSGAGLDSVLPLGLSIEWRW